MSTLIKGKGCFMSTKLDIPSARGEYAVQFADSHEQVQETLSAFIKAKNPSSIVLFSNQQVFSLYGKAIQSVCQGCSNTVYLFPDGEEFKTVATIVEAISVLDKQSLDRKTLFVALGGGLVGDMTGFLASIFLRGVDWIQIPTTLLAMVDSSVGGKTGVNLGSGKNRLGSFYAPNLVCSSPEFLHTLDPKEVQAGMGEVIKHAILDSQELCIEVQKMVKVLIANQWKLTPEHSLPVDILIKICAVKASVVAEDEREKGIRAWLNYGHSIGHAIEKCLQYQGVLHGQAVLLGMWIESAWTMQQGWTASRVVEYLESFVKSIDMSIEIKDTITRMTLFDAISFDKKMQCDKLQLVVIRDFGSVSLRSLDTAEIQSLVAFAVHYLHQFFDTQYIISSRHS